MDLKAIEHEQGENQDQSDCQPDIKGICLFQSYFLLFMAVDGALYDLVYSAHDFSVFIEI
jgi:hypothetical protein